MSLIFGRTRKTEFELTFPSAEAELLRKTYKNAKSVLEYGSGGSTLLAAELGTPCIAIESDANWASDLNAALAQSFPTVKDVYVKHIDIGPTKAWGYPKSADNWMQYWQYPLQVWSEQSFHQPDVVLIDGRMRKACFVAMMLNTKQHVRVLFDDYMERERYHLIEDIVQPNRIVGRMAEFDVEPGRLNATDFSKMIPWFFEMK